MTKNIKTRDDIERRPIGDLIRFDSFDQWIDSLPEFPIGAAGRISDEGGWYGTATYDDAIRYARNGWTGIRPTVDAMMDKIRDRIADRTSNNYEMIYDVCGSFVDVGAFLSGEPECMIDPRPTPTRQGGKVIRIHYNTGGLGGATAECMTARGVAVLALIDALTMLGASTEVTVETSAHYGGGTITAMGKVKEAHEPLDVNRLTFILGNPAMHRRINWATRAAFGLNGCRDGGAAGSCRITMADEVAADVIVAKDHSVDDAIVADPEGWILRTLEGLGFDVKPD